MRVFSRPILAVLLFCACEDGPEQIFHPNTGDPAKQNGFSPSPPFVQDGDQSVDQGEAGGDKEGRAQFCDERELTELIQRMVREPIVPDAMVGGIKLWNEDGTPVHADTLVGRPEDGKFCNPTEIYLDAFVWGPLQEVVVLFDQDTRLVNSVVAFQQYLGTLEAEYTKPDGNKGSISLKNREHLVIDGRELDEYSSSAQQASRTNSWLNHQNVTALYKAVRETFFGASPFPVDFDCVAEQRCDITYTAGGDESVPQDTWVVLVDSGLQLRFTPDGQNIVINVGAVRVAPFEVKGEINFGGQSATSMSFGFSSDTVGSCSFSLDEDLTWGQFKSRCVDDAKSLSRVEYAVYTARDAVNVGFNGMSMAFLRRTSQSPVFKDGERPGDDDRLTSLFFTRSLDAPVEEFRPRTLGNLYKAKLEERLKASIIASNPAIPVESHPLYTYSVSVPFLFDNPQRIGVLVGVNNSNWVDTVVTSIQRLYRTMSDDARAMVDPRVEDPLYLLEPFVDSVLQAFSHGESENPDFKIFRTTDDRRWSIGQAHFIRNGVPYRLQVQYSLNFGALTAVVVERGYSEIDEIYNAVNESIHQGASPYYTIADAFTAEGNPFGVGGNGITVKGFDRRLGTLSLELTKLAPGGEPTKIEMEVGGLPVEDRNGYYRQLRGERWEFIPANLVYFYGQETVMNLFVEPDGRIGAVTQGIFKGSIPFCEGLSISFGDDVPAKLQEWTKAEGDAAQRECEIVFNYSDNGNVLKSVTSIRNKIELTVENGRAINVSIWR